MALAHWQSTFTDDEGNIQAGLSVEIRRESNGALAAIFEDIDGNTAKSNPFTTDSFGYGDFYAVSDRYRIQSTDIDWRNVEVLSADKINELDKRTIYVGSVAELEGLDVPVGVSVQTQGEVTAGDGGERLYRIVAGSTGNADGFLYVDLNNGNQAELIRGTAISDLTVLIPTQYADLQSAVDDLQSKIFCKQGIFIDLMHESGHEPESGLFVENGSYSHFQISSEDEYLTCSSSFSDERLIRAVNASAPTVNCKMDGNGVVRRAYSLEGACSGKINSGLGGRNFPGRVLYMSASTFQGTQLDWDNIGQIFVTSGSAASMGGGSINNSTVDAGRDAALEAAEGGSISAAGFSFSNNNKDWACKDGGTIELEGWSSTGNTESIFRIKCGKVSAFDGTATGVQGAIGDSTGGAVVDLTDCSFTAAAGNSDSGMVFRTTVVQASGVTIDGFGGNGVKGWYGGSYNFINASITDSGGSGFVMENGAVGIIEGGTVTGSANDDLSVAQGSTISANGCTTTNGPGSPDVGDTNLPGAGGFNFSDNGNRGFIWL